MVASQNLEGDEDIFHQYAALVLLSYLSIVDHSVSTASFKSLEGKLVAIECRTFESEKHAVFHQMARIGGDVGVTKKEFVEFCYRHDLKI